MISYPPEMSSGLWYWETVAFGESATNGSICTVALAPSRGTTQSLAFVLEDNIWKFDLLAFADSAATVLVNYRKKDESKSAACLRFLQRMYGVMASVDLLQGPRPEQKAVRP